MSEGTVAGKGHSQTKTGIPRKPEPRRLDLQPGKVGAVTAWVSVALGIKSARQVLELVTAAKR
jgi:hypothetical protein